MSKTRRAVLNDGLKRKAGVHEKSNKAKRAVDRAHDRRMLRELGAWGIQR